MQMCKWLSKIIIIKKNNKKKKKKKKKRPQFMIDISTILYLLTYFLFLWRWGKGTGVVVVGGIVVAVIIY